MLVIISSSGGRAFKFLTKTLFATVHCAQMFVVSVTTRHRGCRTVYGLCTDADVLPSRVNGGNRWDVTQKFCARTLELKLETYMNNTIQKILPIAAAAMLCAGYASQS